MQAAPENPSAGRASRERLALLALTASCLLAGLCYWGYQRTRGGGVVRIDRAEPLMAQYQVDINRADWPELIQVPGVGNTLARRIIYERRENGPFHQLDDLVRVEGIGSRTLDRMRPYLLPIPADTDWASLERSEAEQMTNVQ
jgi:competence protein ComEA